MLSTSRHSLRKPLSGDHTFCDNKVFPFSTRLSYPVGWSLTPARHHRRPYPRTYGQPIRKVRKMVSNLIVPSQQTGLLIVCTNSSSLLILACSHSSTTMLKQAQLLILTWILVLFRNHVRYTRSRFFSMHNWLSAQCCTGRPHVFLCRAPGFIWNHEHIYEVPAQQRCPTVQPLSKITNTDFDITNSILTWKLKAWIFQTMSHTRWPEVLALKQVNEHHQFPLPPFNINL